MTVAIDKADFVDLLERAAWALSDPDWDWFLKGLSAPVQRRLLEEFFHWQTHKGQAEPKSDSHGDCHGDCHSGSKGGTGRDRRNR